MHLIESDRSFLQYPTICSVIRANNFKIFQNEKIHETQQKLHALVSHVEGPSSKSLLIQTVALFEALLTRIKDLQNEIEKLKSLKSIDEEGNKEVIKTNEELVMALESLNTKNMLLTSEKNEAFNQINQLTHSNDTLKCQLALRKTDNEKREETVNVSQKTIKFQ